ncbi:DegQ family serine endoprotease [Balneolaceae bacterium ANBcel3]|nr:DegQ family serine endoprotease [Balneolaceae bacterium ANBcel3]
MNNHYTKFATALTIVLFFLILRFPAGMGSSSDEPYVFEHEPSTALSEEVSESSSDLLVQLNHALVNLADKSKQTVVMVSTERTVRARSSGSMFDFFGPFRDDPFFRDHPFFRDRGGQEREYQQRGLGSGVIVSEDGYILTNHHVIAQADTIKVTLINQKVIPAVVVGSDPNTDVAVLKIEAENLPYISFGDSDELRVGEMVMAIGSPLGTALAHTVTKGIVSAKGRSDLNILGAEGYENFIQTDAAINRGNSGGPLINMKGELIGINTAIASQSGGFQGIGFAIPSNMAQNVMRSIIEKGRVIRGFVGITYQPVDESMARALDLPEAKGLIISDVVDESPAEEAGLQPEDVILKFNGRSIDSSSEFRRRVAEMTPGTEISLLIFRDGSEKEVKVTLGEFPSEQLASADAETLREIIGFSVTELTRELAQRLRIRENVQGIVVEEVDRNSPAAENGLRQGDVITSVNRMPVGSISEFNQVISEVEPGDVLLLQIIRGNNRFFVAFELKSS